MTRKFSSLLCAAALLLGAAVGAPAFARDNAPAGTGKTTDDLKKDGYTCVTVSTGFLECTKPGGDTYWCSSSTDCGVAPKTIKPQTRLPKVNLGNKVLTH